MPMYDFECLECKNTLRDKLVKSKTELGDLKCDQCGSERLETKLNTFGGYGIRGDNGASRTPKSAGSFKRRK
jgi:predicted nucleic acid-binding Zn ribbon protein